MIVRMASPSDHAQWQLLWRGYQNFYQSNIPEVVSRLTWSRFLNPAEPMHCAVAESDVGLVGLVHYIQHRSCWTEGDYIYLQDLFVHPQVRGQGIGRALIEHVYAQGRQMSASRVHWLTHESNQQAMLLYDGLAHRSGFVQYRINLDD